MNRILTTLFLLFLGGFLNCKSALVKEKKIITSQEKENLKKEGKIKIIDFSDKEKMTENLESQPFINEEATKILAEKPRRDEVFRTVVSTNGFDKIQIANPSTIKIKADPAGDAFIVQELKKYNKVNYNAKAVIKIELYPDSGLISRVRFKKPTGISELDKIISEDITRWVFEFPKTYISPRTFVVTYNIILFNKISRDEALEILKKKIDD